MTAAIMSSSPSAKLAFDSVFCSYPRMKIDGELCCVADYATKECFFHIYSYPSFKYVKSLVNKGHSANELEMLTDFCVKDGYIYALCGAQNVVKVFNVNDKNDIKVIRIPKSNGYMSIEINEDGEGKDKNNNPTEGEEYIENKFNNMNNWSPEDDLLNDNFIFIMIINFLCIQKKICQMKNQIQKMKMNLKK